MINRFAALTSRLAVAFAFLFTITACGGGGGGGGGGGFLPDDDDDGTKDAYEVSMELLDLLENPTDTVTTTKPARLKVTVTRKGNPVSGVIVDVTSTIAAISPESGSGLTNAEGLVTFRLDTDGTIGAGTVTATVQDAPAGTESATINIQVVKAALRLGYFEGPDFIDGIIDVVPKETISPDGTATLTLAIIDEFGRIAETDEQVLLVSDCLAANLATLGSSNPVPVTGQTTVSYTANGCEGEDIITASLLETPEQATATVSIAPLSSTAGKIVRVSEEPPVIVLAGTGDDGLRQETSTVTFRVTDATDRAIPNVNVRFELSTRAGGLSLANASDVSDGSGLVSTTVQSGTRPTTFFVYATIADKGISTTSDVMAVSTGVPEQSRITLSVDGGNVVEDAFNVDGVERRLTVRMTDKFGSPVPNGTRADFDAEYGRVDLSCLTGVSNGVRLDGTPRTGECTVLWTSEFPREPSDPDLVKTIEDDRCSSHNGTGPCPDDLGEARGGRATISVSADGEEYFDDANGNNRYDEGEEFENLPEAFTDHNEDGRYTPIVGTPDCGSATTTADCKAAGAEEPFVDLNGNGVYNRNDNPLQYNGSLCPPEGDGVFCSTKLVSVRTDTVLILSDSSTWDSVLVNDNRRKVNTTRWGERFMVYISDQHNNPPPAGSVVKFTTTGDCELESAASVQIRDKVDYGAFGVALQTDGEGEDSNVQVTLESSDGSFFSRSYGCIVRDPPDPNERL